MRDTRRCSRRARRRSSIQPSRLEQALHFQLLTPDSMRLVPVYLSPADAAVREPNQRGPLELAPAAGSIGPAKPGQLADGLPYRDDFDVEDLADRFRLHW